MPTIETESVGLTFDEHGRALTARVGQRCWQLGPRGLVFRLNGELAQVGDVAVTGGGLTATLSSDHASARLRVTAGQTVRIDLEPLSEGCRDLAELDVFLPQDAELHLPQDHNAAWLLTSDMPVGARYGTRRADWGASRVGQSYQFVLARFGNDALRLTTKSLLRPSDPQSQSEPYPRYPSPAVEVERVDGGFILTYAWRPDTSVYLERFDSVADAADDYAGWIEQAFGILPRGADPNRPEWLWNTRLAFVIDLWRSQGAIAHTYRHVIDLMKDLKTAGAPEDTLLYLVGWHWRYDGHYPEYRPHPVLGGAARWDEMVATARATGCRLMLHVCPGFDPFLSSFEAVRAATTTRIETRPVADIIEPQGDDGVLTWLSGRVKPLTYDSGRQAMAHAWDGNETLVIFDTPAIPTRLEAYLTIGGSEADLRVTVNGRSQVAPRERASSVEGCTFPFTFYLEPGRNAVRIDAMGVHVDDWTTLWYRIHDARQFDMLWTYPIACPDIANPAWQDRFVQEVVGMVERSQADAVHIDAQTIGGNLWDWRRPLASMRSQLPGIALGSEMQDEQGLQSIAISQAANLWPHHGADSLAGSQLSWRRLSPVSKRISDRYVRLYPHLCYPMGFVPTESVCWPGPPSLAVGERLRQFQEVLRNADELGIIPTLRVNYRDYGLDPAARAFVTARGRG